MKKLAAASVLGLITAGVSLAQAAPNTHDGFYLQIDLGLGYFSSSAEAGGVEATYSGISVPSALLLGGSPMPGLVIGGGFMNDYVLSPTVKFNDTEFPTDDVSMYLIGIGPFVDYYLNPNEGLHFQAFVGWGGIETSSSGNVNGNDPTGLVLSLGGGYDWWLSSEWSAGVMARVAYAPLSLNDVSYSTIAPALLGTITYN